MEEEMKRQNSMVALQDISIGQDLTPTIPPLTYALHHTHLFTHCSSCFSPLPYTPTPSHTQSLLFCSPHHSPTAAELHLVNRLSSSSDLRAALRLIHALSPSRPSPRFHGLLTNHLALTCNDDDVALEIKQGALNIVEAMRVGGLGECDVMLAESVLCLVLTNSVEVVGIDGLALGVAVYDVRFSWINHSCSPNAVYRFSFCSGMATADDSGESEFKIGPCADSDRNGCKGYGPNIVVRSVTVIKKGEEVTVAYTDLLQPKEARQSHLWSKFRFLCRCARCTASTSVDHSLQEILVNNIDLSKQAPDLDVLKEVAAGKFSDYIDEVIAEYLSAGHPQWCCQKLENMLTHGLCVEQLEIKEGLLKPIFRLNPLHHLSLNAYTALASAYKVCASDLLAHCSETGRDQLEAFSMSRISAAYSLMLAGSTHHLFGLEPSIIVSVANFWINAGDSFLSLAKSSIWTTFGILASDLTSVTKHKFCNCWLMGRFNSSEAISSCNQVLNADFGLISSEFLNCVSNTSKKVWSFLCHGCHCLKMYENPIDYSWTDTASTSRSWNFEAHSKIDGDPHCNDVDFICPKEAQIDLNQERFNLYQVGVHSLLYGGYLASICYGPKSHINSRIEKISLDVRNW